MPLGGHTPIHPRWSQHHRPVAIGTQTGRCRITRRTGSTGTLDDNLVWHPGTTRITIYAGTCHIAPPAPVTYTTPGERRTGTTDYQVAIAWDAPEILDGDDVEVLDAEDPELVGRHLRVTGPLGDGGTQQWERLLTCVQDTTSRER
ncbi:hypothetical protein DQ384_05425 [Sphaerisporangium album]|uniref:Uncharacterized protein n=1 Tax=Sphaerisporangium album TaxID=509200 RepID=A0A367FNK6_9ACTN|nr:DUF6093 family protein [Sphaerisporangium album]RCG31983.1 hypothetical protein DQ384_05425 [Sphaerisporangium album]